ncbi:CPBP family intramembrane glutamic endopeptidase [Virgisporangium aurantiacum]|uniref:Abortive infection protein n=1 Tax=Virgisporangium aurantiacum TaxID=175570 RepID=A0A8J3Z921_9ACTN|nr:CPBP family intramembrane glutamic endopeptidase [Virgisporangium aurantiacum]GIJ57170.1 abortive infection protein [Virgisporangium aurantiacum]
MFTTLSATTRAVTYYLMALTMCVVLALTWPNGEAAAVLAMFTPMLSVLLMQLVVTRDGWRRSGWTPLGLGRLGIRFWPAAVGLPAAILLVSEAVLRLTGLTTWHLPSGSDTVLTLIDLPVMLVFVFFEEIGWRGYFGPLLASTGRRLPHLLTGLLHGIWHLPLVFFATGGYLTEGNRWIIVPIFLAVFTCAGQLYGWIREVSGSVYPAVILHTAFNMGLTIAVIGTATNSPDTVAAVGREAGIVTLVAVAAAALWVSTRRTAALGDPTFPAVADRANVL